MKTNFSFLRNRQIATALVLVIVLIGFGIFFGGSAHKALGVVGGSGGGSNGGDTNGSGTRGGAVSEATELCGFAWGATNESSGSPKPGVGWVSFNSKDCDSDGNGTISTAEASAHPGCPAGATASYKVTVDSSNRLNGYAWSSNLGWLRFGSMSSFPNTSGNNQQNARISGNSELYGWARFCAGTSSGTCSTMTARSDGWDGWVSLRGNTSGGQIYGAVFNQSTSKFSGYTWGGPVVGWLNWNPGSGNEVRLCTTQTLTNEFTATPSSGPAPLLVHLVSNGRLALDSQKNLAQVGGGSFEYRFDCDLGASWGNWGSGNTADCTYNNAGTYNPKGEVRVNSLTAVGSAFVQVDSVTGPGGNALGAACSVAPVSAVNQPIQWEARITVAGTPNYNYEFVFEDGTDITNNTYETTVTKTHSFHTIGRKTVTVNVTDSSTPSITGTCTATTDVQVNPIIKEI